MRNLLFAILAGLLIPLRLSACDCKQPTVQKASQDADVVFDGYVVKSRTVKLAGLFRGQRVTLHTFRVLGLWKGDVSADVAFYRSSLEDICRVADFRKGERWLIFAYRVDANKWLGNEQWRQIQAQGIPKPDFVYATNQCQKSEKFPRAQVDIRELGLPRVAP